MSIDAYPLIADWITTRDGRLLVHTGKVDIGQRISTALTEIAHEELTIPPDQIDIAPVRTSRAPDEGMTSGSNSIEQSGHAVRCAAATLRARLIALAVSRLGGAPKDWRISGGVLRVPGSNRQISVLNLIDEVPADTEIDRHAPFLTRPPGTVAKPAMRGLSEMVLGRFTFVHDLEAPGMLHARTIHPPHARARLDRIELKTTDRSRVEGLHIIRDGSFLAIAGSQEWPLVQASVQLAKACCWDPGGGVPETDVFTQLVTANASRFPVIDGVPQNSGVPDALPKPDMHARYERPYQMHGALAPSAAMAHWDGETLKIHCHSQGIYPLRTSIADSLGLRHGQVDITHVPGSGCYGHNGADDAAFEAALISIALPDTPILLKWSREDEHSNAPYAPAMVIDLAAKLADGKIAAFSAEAYSDTHGARPRPGPNRAGPARLLANRLRADAIGPVPPQPNMGRHTGIHRNLDPIYAFPKKRLVKNLVTGGPHRTSAMRCLGAAANIFALESFLDELARGQGADPIAFRKAYLTDPRDRAVLDELQRKTMLLPDLPETGGRGIAYAQYKNQMTRVGICVDIDTDDRANIYLTRANIVADAGRVIDTEGLSAQLEGGFIQAASWALYEAVTWDRDGILSRDWDSYPVIRFGNIPTIDVTILNRPEDKSVGAGEASPGPAIAAIANAVFDATGIRMRRMPFTPDAIMQKAFAD
ncbi:molybdopterin cofactor-binding domain-containing protein [Candidatus Halocynthiibacter alkanivorans]|uniref:molybdopterin cofactor-binding domain-containing protein n=1 Tax=Candidatus Halocynthiibacter alkanivorans TaxID=2267619 RepID=UPI00135B22FE|nr:molybdopterin cofactor-binding domain-containing protein [Candidatus Halocynthiibacter alkanivorans]